MDEHHDWTFLPAQRDAGDEVTPGVIAVCRRCGTIRSASVFDGKVDLTGECDGRGGDRTVQSFS